MSLRSLRFTNCELDTHKAIPFDETIITSFLRLREWFGAVSKLAQGRLWMPGIGAILHESSGIPPVPITFTTNYKETLNAETVEKIDELLEENYALDDMLEFIDTYNENDFVAYYEEYVRCGEKIGYEAVDALIGETGYMSDIEDCDERYQGCYDDEADFAEDFYNQMDAKIPEGIVVDWEQTWESNLRYDYTACKVGYRQVYIFRDCSL